jgi:uracil-DNA glycosylase
MKKQSLQNLKLNKKSIANFSITGGLASEAPSNPSEENPNSIEIEQCTPWSMMPNSLCTCA